MEHELVLPLPATVVREALQDPALLARCVPGLSPDTVVSGPEIDGRLRLRVGGSTITYRGTLSLIGSGPDVLTVLAEGQEARGSGIATATLRLALEAGADDAATLRVTGDLSATGRIAEFDAAAQTAAGRRLLDRFADALIGELGEPADGANVVYLEDRTSDADLAAGEDGLDDLDDLIAFADLRDDEVLPDDLGPLPYEPDFGPDPLLTGPVRRSIVGRSAEEVDHAPPRGRYAPAPPAHSARARAATRWGHSEAGLATPPGGGRGPMPWMIGGGVVLLGGAVVLVRALRRR